VRGAANHLVGLRRVGTVVGINNDPGSSFFEAADYGLVCDWREGVEAIRSALRERGLLRRSGLS
jgi:electron transfer flavoprotein alpha subunit